MKIETLGKKKFAIALLVAVLLFAVIFAGCSQQGGAPAGNGSGQSNGSAPSLKSSDVPAYNDSIDSGIDSLSQELG